VWHPLATALTAQPSRPRVAAAATPVREQALEAMQRGRLREAALRLGRQLRDEVVSGSWEDEHGARILLASVYQNAGEMALAVRHLVLAGAADEVEDLGAAAGDLYLDVREHLRAPTYWTQATAFRLIAAQADLLPNAHVQEVAEHGLSVLDAARAGTLMDTPFSRRRCTLRPIWCSLSLLTGSHTHTQLDCLITLRHLRLRLRVSTAIPTMPTRWRAPPYATHTRNYGRRHSTNWCSYCVVPPTR